MEACAGSTRIPARLLGLPRARETCHIDVMKRMGRPVLLAFAALLLLQCSGIAALFDEDACAPLCTDCACCPALRSETPAAPNVPVPVAGTIAARPDATPPARESRPADIFHVPRLTV